MRGSYPDASARLSTGRLSPTGCIHRPPSSAFLTADDGTKLRLWHRLPSSSPLQQTHLVNNHHQRWSTSCVASVQSYPSIPKIPTLGRVGCRRSRTHACRRYLPQGLSHLCRTELLTTYGDSRLVTKPSRYHLPGKPKMHFFSPLVSRQLHDGSSNIGVMLWISTSFGRTQQDRRLGRRTPLRCAREMRAS